VKILDLGLVEYEKALSVQEGILRDRIDNKIEDTLIVLEHVSVISMGRHGSDKSILDKEFFQNKGIEVVVSGRGGDITYHSPGQLVMYPVVSLGEKLRDVSKYIDFLEKTARNALMEMGLKAQRYDDRRGVWVDGKKIAFIGVAFKKWVTYHGIAINIANDIEAFEHFNPCGERGISVTSVEKESGCVDMSACKRIFIDRFEKDMEVYYGGVDGNNVAKTV